MAMRQGDPLPDAILNAPQLHLGLGLFLGGFLDLNDERQVGFSEGPIPWRAMQEYCHVHDIAGEQREDFFHHIKQMDAAFLKLQAEKAERNRKK